MSIEVELGPYNNTIADGVFLHNSFNTASFAEWSKAFDNNPASNVPFNNNQTTSVPAIGLNLGTDTATLTAVRLMTDIPSFSNFQAYMTAIQAFAQGSAKLQSGSNGTTWTDVSSSYAQSGSSPAYAYYRNDNFAGVSPETFTAPAAYNAMVEIPATSGFAAKYHQLMFPTSLPSTGFAFNRVAEVRFYGLVSAMLSTYKPIPPDFSPASYRSQSTLSVTMTSRTSGSTIYYTIDGTTPAFNTSTGVATGTTTSITNGSSISLTTQTTDYVVQAISGINVSGTWIPSRDVTNGVYSVKAKRITPAMQLWDDGKEPLWGAQRASFNVSLSSPGTYVENGTWYFYDQWKQVYKFNSKTDASYLGIRCYSTTDLVNYTDHGFMCPFPPDTSTLFWLHPDVVKIPVSAQADNNKRYVMWMHQDNSSLNAGKGLSYTSPSPIGPWSYNNALTANVGVKGCRLFQDDNGDNYLIHTNNAAGVSTQINYATQLTADGTDILGGNATPSNQIVMRGVVATSRESPIVWTTSLGGQKYYCYIDTLAEYYDHLVSNTLEYKTATTLAGITSATATTLWAHDALQVDASGTFHSGVTQDPCPFNVQSSDVVDVNGKKVYIGSYWGSSASYGGASDFRTWCMTMQPINESVSGGVLTLSLPFNTGWDITDFPPVYNYTRTMKGVGI